tara:strand:- start:30478 stop:30798 length:321 start_codon:yes stop_codon:yes gene_type:complete
VSLVLQKNGGLIAHSDTIKKTIIKLIVIWCAVLIGGFSTLWLCSRVPSRYMIIAVALPLYSAYQVAAFVMNWVMIAAFGREIEPVEENHVERFYYFFIYLFMLILF